MKDTIDPTLNVKLEIPNKSDMDVFNDRHTRQGWHLPDPLIAHLDQPIIESVPHITVYIASYLTDMFADKYSKGEVQSPPDLGHLIAGCITPRLGYQKCYYIDQNDSVMEGVLLLCNNYTNGPEFIVSRFQGYLFDKGDTDGIISYNRNPVTNGYERAMKHDEISNVYWRLDGSPQKRLAKLEDF
jgi:hypothetical protein|tara:strand:- start:3819 stop:4373 length:555 start_codon:yes stop_codon:yes gene_type:complete